MPNAFKLCLPETLKLYLIFHMSLFKHYIEGPFPDSEALPPRPVIFEGHREYIIRKTLDFK